MLGITPAALFEIQFKNQRVPNEIMSLLLPFCRDLYEFSDHVAEFKDRKESSKYVFQTRQIAAREIRKFHENADTLNEGVRRGIDQLCSQDPILLRVAHQPNFMPYAGIVCQFLAMHVSATLIRDKYNKNVVQLYLIVDYDSATDSRFRNAHIPTVRCRDGFLKLSSLSTKSSEEKLMYATPKPPECDLNLWFERLRAWIQDDLATLRKLGIKERIEGTALSNLAEVQEIVEKAYEKASTLAELNSIVLSRILNYYWGLPILFLPGSRIQQAFKPFYENAICHPKRFNNEICNATKCLTSNGIILKSFRKIHLEDLFPLWYHCPRCMRRVSTNFSEDQHLVVFGTCPCCKTEYRFDLGPSDFPNLDSISDNISARIVLDNIVEQSALGISGALGYIGSAEHTIITKYVAECLGITMPPQCLWRPRSVTFGTSECRAVAGKHSTSPRRMEASTPKYANRCTNTLGLVLIGRSSIVYHLVNSGFKVFLNEWLEFLKSGAKLTSLNVFKNTGLVIPQNLEKEVVLVASSMHSRGIEIIMDKDHCF